MQENNGRDFCGKKQIGHNVVFFVKFYRILFTFRARDDIIILTKKTRRFLLWTNS